MKEDKLPIEVIADGVDPGNKKLMAEIVASFITSGVHDKDLPEGPEKDHAKAICDAFTSSVDFLRRGFPNQAIQARAAILWDLCGSKIIPLALGPNVPTLSFAKMGPNGIIFVPEDWVAQISRNPVHQMAAVVFVGSQAVDCYNDLIKTREEARQILRRARLYEAEYLLTLRQVAKDYKLNDYQESVLKEFPKGLASVPSLVYVSKPFVAPS